MKEIEPDESVYKNYEHQLYFKNTRLFQEHIIEMPSEQKKKAINFLVSCQGRDVANANATVSIPARDILERAVRYSEAKFRTLEGLYEIKTHERLPAMFALDRCCVQLYLTPDTALEEIAKIAQGYQDIGVSEKLNTMVPRDVYGNMKKYEQEALLCLPWKTTDVKPETLTLLSQLGGRSFEPPHEHEKLQLNII